MADIDTVERLLCQRYNVNELDAGELSRSLAQARGGDTEALRKALGDRELYRWGAPIYAALDEPEPEPEPLTEMTIAELRAHAEDHDIDLGDARLKADIVKAIFEAEDSDPEEDADD
jgi:hypothetical protein